jgi:hypothetical protein
MEFTWLWIIALLVTVWSLTAIALVKAVLFAITLPREPADIDPKANVDRKKSKDKN